MSKRKLTPEQIAYIKENYKNTQAKVLASCLGISTSTLQQWSDELGLRSGKKTRIMDRNPLFSRTKQIAEEKKFKRPPAMYSNPSREQHIERILNG